MPRSTGKIMMQFLQALAGSPAAPSITGKSASLSLLTIKLPFNGIGYLYEPESSRVTPANAKPNFEASLGRLRSSKAFQPIPLFQERLSNVQQSQQE
ncbi:MAG: hypothetical protein Q8L56_02330 [Rhodocyclaceae bacterium]|nr:hypothetical protein [Rhodocyclaceae bacterium]